MQILWWISYGAYQLNRHLGEDYVYSFDTNWGINWSFLRCRGFLGNGAAASRVCPTAGLHDSGDCEPGGDRKYLRKFTGWNQCPRFAALRGEQASESSQASDAVRNRE